MQVIAADAVPAQPWRNGGGHTRELLAGAAGHGVGGDGVGGDGVGGSGSDGSGVDGSTFWQWRISLADILTDGPFSTFAGVQRWFAVVDGAGVELAFADCRIALRRGDAPLAFDGAAAPGCRLLGGPTRDLNLMLRHVDGVMRRGTAFDESWPLRGRFDVATRTLHWGLPAGPLQAAGESLWVGIAA